MKPVKTGEYHNIPESYDALRLPVDTSDTAKQLLGSSKPAAPQNPRFREERAEANTAQNTSMNSTGEATRAASSANASDVTNQKTDLTHIEEYTLRTQSLAEESVLKGLVSTNFSILEGLTLESLSNATAASGSGTGICFSCVFGCVEVGSCLPKTRFFLLLQLPYDYLCLSY
eukprot:1340337-Amorphochlora_amoeboformis.AAC.1